MTFTGRDRSDVKRKALNYWARNSRRLGLTLTEFLRCCRLDPSETRIVFTAPHAMAAK